MSKEDRVTFRKILVGGFLLTACSVGLVTSVVLVITWFQDGFGAALAGFGMSLFLAAGALLLSPLLGAAVSLGNRSWHAFKMWSACGFVAIVLNVLIGFAAIGLSERF